MNDDSGSGTSSNDKTGADAHDDLNSTMKKFGSFYNTLMSNAQPNGLKLPRDIMIVNSLISNTKQFTESVIKLREASTSIDTEKASFIET